MKIDDRVPWRLRVVSWVAFALTWLVILGYITLLVANTRAALSDAPSSQAPLYVSAIFRALALPGLPPSSASDGLIFLLMCVVFILALRTSPALLRPRFPLAAKPAVAPPTPATPTTAPAPAVTLVAAPAPAPTTEPRRVFISHSSGDNTFGEALADRLRAAGFAVWYDSHGGPGAEGTWQGGIPPATYWQDEIVRELTGREVFLVILTEQSTASKWVHDEIGLAWSQKNSADVTGGKIVVPVLRQTCKAPPLVTLVQRVDYRPEVNQDDAFAALLIALRHGSTIPAPPVEVGPPFDIATLPGVARFIGRADDAQAVIHLLTGAGADGGAIAGIASTNGLAGIGKTALATEVIRRLMAANAFPDGIAVVVARDTYDPVLLLKQILTRFSDGRRPPEDDELATLADRARQMLGGKRALVVLDNVEPGPHVDQVAQALRAAGAALLLTSRAELPAVPREARVKLDVLPLPEALDLFASYYGRGAALDLTADEQRDATTIVTLLGRHTLAVKLQAANAATLERPLHTLAAELEANPSKALLLEDGAEAVAYVLDSSLAALDPPARRLFVALGAFATGDVGRQAALYMGVFVARNAADAAEMADDEAQAVAERSLKALITLRLADPGLDETMPEESDRERVRLHPLVYTYAHDHFNHLDSEDRTALSRAVARWYADYIQNKADTAKETDERNILGALAWAHAASDDALLVRLSQGSANYWNTHSRTAERERYLPAAVAAAERQVAAERSADTVRAAATLHGHYATLLQQLGRMREFKEMAEASLREYQEVKDQRGEGVALSLLGDLARQEGDLATAKTNYSRFLAIMQAVHDQRGEGVALSLLGDLALQEGDLATAKTNYARYLEIMQATNSLRSQGIALSLLGDLALQEGDLETATDYYTRCLEIMRAVHDLRNEGAVLSLLGDLALQEGDLETAKTNYSRFLAIMQTVHDQREEGVALSKLGDLALQEGDLATAKTNYARYLAIMQTVHDQRGEGVALSLLGDLARQEGDLATAKTNYSRVLAIMQTVHDQRGEGVALGRLGALAWQEGDLDTAKSYYTRDLEIQQKVHDALNEGRVGFTLARIHEAEGDLDAAEQSHRQSLAIAFRLRLAPEILPSLEALGTFLLEHQRNRDEGCQLLAQAAALYEQLGQDDAAARVQQRAAELGCGTME